MKTSLFAIVLGVAALLVGGYALSKSVSVPSFGAAAGPDVSFRTFFHDNAIIGGFDLATSSQGTATYTAAQFSNAKVIEQQAPAALTVTFPTNAQLSAIGYLQNVGDTDTKFIHASTTLVTLAGSTGVTLSTASSTKAISANSTGVVTCARLGASEARLIQCVLVAD